MRLRGSAGIVAVVAALCCVCVALAAWTLAGSRELELRNGFRRVEGLALLLEQHADQTFEAVAHLLDMATVRALEADRDQQPLVGALRSFFADRHHRLPQLRAAYFVDSSGTRRPIVGDRRDASLDLSKSDWFRLHRQNKSQAVKIVEPDPSDVVARQQLHLSRRLESESGQFAGLLVAEIDLDFLRAFYERIQLTENGTVALLTLSGRMLVRSPYDPDYVGRDFRHMPVLAVYRPQSEHGSFVVTSPLDGQRRLLGYRSLSNFPLVVYGTVAEEPLLAAWRGNLVWYASFIVGLLVATGLLARQTVREDRQRRAAQEAAKRSLADLKVQKELVEEILNALPDGTQLFDANQRMVGWNDRLFEIMALDRDDVLAAPDPTHRFFELLVQRGEYGPGDTESLIRNRLAIARSALAFTYKRRMVDGRWLECRGQPIPGLGLLAVYRDITAEVEREARMRATQISLEEARTEAEQANRAKSEFLAGMSHELRTPLNAIMGFSEIIGGLIFGRDAVDRYAEYGRDVHGSAVHLLGLIDSLLDLAKIEARRMELREEEVALRDCIDRAIAMCRPVATRGEVELRVRSDVPQVALRADEQKLVQSLLNVLSNAIKFTRAGGAVEISAELGPSAVSAGAAVATAALSICVTDTGIGIAPQDVPKVFEPFGQVKGEFSAGMKGTGLGMPLTKALIEMHGGTVELESTLGVGTTVRLVLPGSRITELRDAHGATNDPGRAA